MGDTEPPVIIPIGTLDNVDQDMVNRAVAASKPKRVCSNCRFRFKEGNDLVCRYNPPQVTFLVVPVPVTVGTPNGPQVRQGMQAVPHTSFPIVRPELWCGRFEST